jgi:hypothetical protein
MLDPVERSAARLHFRQLPKIIPEAIDSSPVKPRPKGRFTDCPAPHPRKILVVVSGPRNHVQMRVYKVHAKLAFVL